MKKILFVSLMMFSSVGYTFAADTELTADLSDTGLSEEERERRRWQEAVRIVDYGRRYEEAKTRADALRIGQENKHLFENRGQPESVEIPLQKEYEDACKGDAARRADEKSRSRGDRAGYSHRRLW